MALAQVSEAIGEIFESGCLRQFEGQCAGLEYGHQVILRWALDTKVLHAIPLPVCLLLTGLFA